MVMDGGFVECMRVVFENGLLSISVGVLVRMLFL